MINIKKNTLEKCISDTVSEFTTRPWMCESEFAIETINGVQVTIRFNKDEDEHFEGNLEEYEMGVD